MAESKTEYYAPLNGGIVELTGGHVVAPGETVKLTDKEAGEDFNKSLIKDGLLIKVPK